MKLLIGADFVPTERNEQYFIEGDAEYLLGHELCQLINSADFRIFNLEVPLTDDSKPIIKCGPNLIANRKSVRLYKELGINLLTLANNHIMDQGIEGYTSTISILDEKEIDYVGVAENIFEARHAKIVNIDRKMIGIYACVEHEFSISGEKEPGANPFDPMESFDDVERLKKQCDIVIVLYHGGKEHYRYPSPNLQKCCRNFVDKGADLVICQHSHCVGCEEKFKQGTIVYGQGNFLFDHSSRIEWETGMLIQLTDDGVNYIPIIKNEERVRLANAKEAEQIRTEFEKRSKEILMPGFIEENYKHFSNELIDDYLWQFSGASHSLLFRILNKVSGYKFYKWYVRRRYNQQQRMNLLNYIECEAHREVIICGLKGKG